MMPVILIGGAFVVSALILGALVALFGGPSDPGDFDEDA